MKTRPTTINNRPGLPAIEYRIGSHQSFLQTMIARLAAKSNLVSELGEATPTALAQLTSRESDDPSIAILDAWATLADLLTFYQERIANEAFLRTAIRRPSVELLAKMIGFTPRAGLSSSVYLTFEVDDTSDEVRIPAGTPAKSTPIPGTDLKPETFETTNEFIARPQWNAIRPRQKRPHNFRDDPEPNFLTFEGAGLNVKPNDLFAIEPQGVKGEIYHRLVESVREFEDGERNRFTIVKFSVDVTDEDRLYEVIRDILVKFRKRTVTSQLFTGNFIDESIIAPYESERKKRRPITFLKEDMLVDQFLVTELLDGHFAKKKLQDYSNWFEEARAFLITGTKYSDIRQTFRREHLLAARSLKELADIEDDLSNDASFAKSIMAAKQALWFVPPGATELSINRPPLLFAETRARPIDKGAEDTMFSNHRVEGLEANTELERIRIKIDVTDSLVTVPAELKEINVANPGDIAAVVHEKLGKLKVAVQQNGSGFGYARVRVQGFKRQDGNGETRLLNAIQPIGKGTAPFRDFVHDLTVYGSPTAFPLPLNIRFGSDLNKVYRVLVRGDETEESFGKELYHKRKPLSEIEADLRQLQPTDAEGEDRVQRDKLSNIHIEVYDLPPEEPVAPAEGPVEENATDTDGTPETGETDADQTTIDEATAAGDDTATDGSLNEEADELPDISDYTVPVAYGVRTFVPIKVDATRIRSDISVAIEQQIQPINPMPVEPNNNLLAALKRHHASALAIGTGEGDVRISKLLGDSDIPESWKPELGFLSDPAQELVDLWQGLKQHVEGVQADELKRHSPIFDGKLVLIRDASSSDPGTNPVAIDDHLATAAIDLFLPAPFTEFAAINGGLDGLQRDLLRAAFDKRRDFVEDMKNAVTPLENKDLAGSFADILKRLADPLQIQNEVLDDLNHHLKLTVWKNAEGSFADFASVLDAPDGIDKIEKSLDVGQVANAVELSVIDRANGQLIVDQWRSLLNDVRGKKNTRQPGLRSTLTDIIGEFDSAGTIGGLSSRDLKQLFSTNSGLIPQVLAAINPQARDELLDRLRRYREIKVEKPRAWVFRNQTRIFGWNAPSRAATSSADDVIRPPALKNPIVNAAVEKNDRVFLDGQHRQTANGSVIAIRSHDDGPVGTYRILSASETNRTDYGVSNSATKVDLDSEWWSPSAPKVQEVANTPDVVTQLDSGTVPNELLRRFGVSPNRARVIGSGENWRIYDGKTLVLVNRKGNMIEFSAAGLQILRFPLTDAERTKDAITKQVESQFQLMERQPLTFTSHEVEPNLEWKFTEGADKDTDVVYTARVIDEGILALFSNDPFESIRSANIWCDSEQLKLADTHFIYEPSDQQPSDSQAKEASTKVLSESQSNLELDGFYPFLNTQSKILTRAVPYHPIVGWKDADGDQPIGDSEISDLFSIVAVRHDADNKAYGDRLHTTITLSKPLGRYYWLEQFRVYANVVEATHGETVREVIGSGNGSAHQTMPISSAPLTRLSASNPRGEAPQIDARVNNVLWKNTPLSGADDNSDAYEIIQAADGATSLRFGDGQRGRRIPTGDQNVRAVYRTGIGSPGNVDAYRIDQLPSPPLGVLNVINPIRSAGGSDADTLEQTRRRARVASSRLDRLISATDFSGFALSFAGIDKAHTRMEGGTIVITVAGADPNPLPTAGALLRNLNQSMREFGDPEAQYLILPHRSLLIFLKAKLKIDSRYEWSDVEQRVRDRLFATFDYRVRDLNQDVLRSEVIAIIQGTSGVEYVDVDNLAPLDEGLSDQQDRNLSRIRLPLEPTAEASSKDTSNEGQTNENEPDSEAGAENSEAPADDQTTPARGDEAAQSIDASKLRPAEICFLDRKAPDTVILERIQ